jgi:short-subunit dehydrogenase
MSEALQGKTVFITGATGGIGAATARELVRRGANVVITDLGADQVSDLASDLGAQALPLVVDVIDRGSLDQAFAAAVEHFGKVDIVFANAGIANDPPLTVAGLTDEMYEKVIDVDLHGVWHTVRAGLPQVIENGGYVLITSSIYAFMNGVVNAPYAMSKAAVEQLGRALRTELAYRGASACVLYPGWVDTNIAKVAMRDAGPVKELADHAFRGPLGKAITPERAAKAIANGMEKRAPRIIVPRRWVPFSMLRGLFNMATDSIMERDAKIAGVLERIDDSAPGS